MKLCTRCGEERPLADFWKTKRTKDGLQVYCKFCMAEINRTWHKTHPERMAEISRRSKEGPGWKAVLLGAARRRAAANGIPFDLTVDDFEIPEFCPVLGVKLIKGRDKASPDSATLDRIEPALGYVAGNVQVISRRANMMKSDASADELRRFAAWVMKEFGE